jgi:hypothetical protein
MNSTNRFLAVLLTGLLSGPWILAAVPGPVVVNEIQYHPPDDQDQLQWIELHNPGTAQVDLAGWKFAKGVDFTFPAGAALGGGGYGVVVRDRAAFVARHGSEVLVLGEFKGRLKRGGERLELQDGAGKVSDTVKYEDRYPWPLAPDGYGATLERVRAVDSGDEPANWAPSSWGTAKVPGGTPGRVNGAVTKVSAPRMTDLKFDRWVAGGASRVEWKSGPTAPGTAVVLKYQVVAPEGGVSAEETLAAQAGAGAAATTWSATIPPAGDQRVVRFWVETRDAAGNAFRWPSANEVRPTFSYLSWKQPERGTIGQLHVWDGGRVESSGQAGQYGPAKKVSAGLPKPRGRGTAVYLPALGAGSTAVPELRDHIRVGSRKAGWKVRFHKDATLSGVRTANVVFEDKPRFILSEHLSYELFRQSRVMTPHSEPVRWVHNGVSAGYHLLVEQPNQAFLARHQRDPAGNLFKLLWYGQGLVGQHEKKNNPTTGHSDLRALVQGLAAERGGPTWDFVQANFAVEPTIDYYVVSHCIQNWDGFFNNYFAYHAPGAGGRWEIIPWDEDKTWGDYDGGPRKYDWYSLPLTYGMTGDQPPSGGGNWTGGGFGPGMWWRPGGWFSGPLLAQKEFRARFLKRLREFAELEFTEERFRPVIDNLEKRMESEVRHRAEVRGSTEESLLRQFHADMDSFRRQLTGRRAFLLRELSKAP